MFTLWSCPSLFSLFCSHKGREDEQSKENQKSKGKQKSEENKKETNQKSIATLNKIEGVLQSTVT